MGSGTPCSCTGKTLCAGENSRQDSVLPSRRPLGNHGAAIFQNYKRVKRGNTWNKATQDIQRLQGVLQEVEDAQRQLKENEATKNKIPEIQRRGTESCPAPQRKGKRKHT